MTFKTKWITFISIMILFIHLVGVHADDTLPGSFTVLEENIHPTITQLGLHRSTGIIISPQSGFMIPNTRHSIRFSVSNDTHALEEFQVRVALFRSNSQSIESFNAAKTNAFGDAFVVNFSNNQPLTIEYEDGVGSLDHSFDDQFFGRGLDSIVVPGGANRFDFQIFFNMSKVVHYFENYVVAVSFTQTISGISYNTYASEGFYKPSAYTEFQLVPTSLSWSLEVDQTFELFDYTSEQSLALIPSSHMYFISNLSFDLDMYSDEVWSGQDLDDPLNNEAVVEAILSDSPVRDQSFGLKVNTTGVPNTGVDLISSSRLVTTYEKTSEQGMYGQTLYVWLGILGNNFLNGQYQGFIYLSLTQ